MRASGQHMFSIMVMTPERKEKSQCIPLCNAWRHNSPNQSPAQPGKNDLGIQRSDPFFRNGGAGSGGLGNAWRAATTAWCLPAAIGEALMAAETIVWIILIVFYAANTGGVMKITGDRTCIITPLRQSINLILRWERRA
jgi:hypothetical protein